MKVEIKIDAWDIEWGPRSKEEMNDLPTKAAMKIVYERAPGYWNSISLSFVRTMLFDLFETYPEWCKFNATVTEL